MSQEKLSELLNLGGKTAIVTGAGRGIGQGIALRLAEAGAAVVVTDINLELAEETVGLITSAGGSATALVLDVNKTSNIQGVVDETLAKYGDIDILVNNAAIFPPTPALNITEAQWDLVLGINLKGAFFLAQAVARAMIEAKHGGKIINIASLGYRIPPGLLSHYDASKGGIVSLTQSLAKELGPHGICVTTVAPGEMKTPGGKLASEDIAKSMRLNMSTLPIRSPLGRYGTADDVGKVVYFLATGLSDYVTGSVIEVGGGHQLY